MGVIMDKFEALLNKLMGVSGPDGSASQAEQDQERINKEAKKRDDAAGMNKGGMPKKNFAKPGSYSSAYNKGGMGKAKVGHTDYRKGGMIYTTKNK